MQRSPDHLRISGLPSLLPWALVILAPAFLCQACNRAGDDRGDHASDAGLVKIVDIRALRSPNVPLADARKPLASPGRLRVEMALVRKEVRLHRNSGLVAIVFTGGAGTLQVGTATNRVGADTLVTVPAGAPVRLLNTGPQGLRALLFFSAPP